MKLQNRKTGEIVELLARPSFVKRDKENYLASEVICFNSLAELNDEWCDYEEPKEYWYIDPEGTIICEPDDEAPYDDYRKQIGNYFETKEEAEKAVEKLKAWKRLKDKGFRFTGWATNEGIRGVDFEVPDSFFSELNHSCISDETRNDLDLLFGGEE